MASAGVTVPRGSCFQQWLILGGKSLRAGQACSGASHEYFSCPAVLAVRIPASGIPVMCSSQQLACCQHRCVPLAAGIYFSSLPAHCSGEPQHSTGRDG